MRVVRSARDLQLEGSVGLVPTMGAFHQGHLSLFRAARAENDTVVVSLFLNAAQFGPGEDLERYPRDEEHDARFAEQEGVDVLFAPAAEERERALALPRALQAQDRSLLNGLEVDYFEVADFDPRVLAAAVRVGGTRLIDNVVLEGENR